MTAQAQMICISITRLRILGGLRKNFENDRKLCVGKMSSSNSSKFLDENVFIILHKYSINLQFPHSLLFL